jgi:hypothetical protein
MPGLRSSYGFLLFCHLIRFFLAGAPVVRLGGCPRIQKAGIIKFFRKVQYSNNVYSF